MLRSLRLRNVGPAPELALDLAPRLNVLTGDNGLGKTLVLDAAWFALTWTWAGERALPSDAARAYVGPLPGKGFLDAMIEYRLADRPPGSRVFRHGFYAPSQDWLPRGATAGGSGAARLVASDFPSDGIVLYARVDGGFTVWDPYRNQGRFAVAGGAAEDRPRAYHFDRGLVWDGLQADGRTLCNGLIRDWVSWQQADGEAWRHLQEVLNALSGDGVEALTAGPARRVKVDDVRDIPTLNLAYGNVPITHASAGMRRICALAYMVVWAWQEHRLAAQLRREPPTDALTLLIDEVEAHLHPAWQRRILPAVLAVLTSLAPGLRVQVLAATHAPLVLASLEPEFDADRDALFAFDFAPNDRPSTVVVNRVPWVRHGDASDWLTSDVFDLRWSRSLAAEKALERALRALDDPPDPTRDASIDAELRAALGETDPFWMRWHARRGDPGAPT